MHKAIRFVGGPWHNRIERVELAPKVIIRAGSGVCAGIKTLYKHELYYLADFITHRGTRYLQYVHSSLLTKDGEEVAVRAYRERFPVWRIDSRQLQARLRRAMRWEKIK